MPELVAGLGEAVNEEHCAFLWPARRRERLDVMYADFGVGALYPDGAVVVGRVALCGLGVGLGGHAECSEGDEIRGSIGREDTFKYSYSENAVRLQHHWSVISSVTEASFPQRHPRWGLHVLAYGCSHSVLQETMSLGLRKSAEQSALLEMLFTMVEWAHCCCQVLDEGGSPTKNLRPRGVVIRLFPVILWLSFTSLPAINIRPAAWFPHLLVSLAAGLLQSTTRGIIARCF